MVLQSIWGWQPALYLFLGGMGAGAFIMAAVLYLIDQERHAKIVCVSMWASAIGLGLGLLLLLSELTQPARGLLMWQSFSHFTSWMTYGAWGAFAAIAVFGLSAVLAVDKVGKRCTSEKQAKHFVCVRKVLAVVGIALGLFVAVYTGMLLMMAPGVPLWNTPLLPCLFAVSGIDTGVALVEVIAVLLARKDPLAPRARVLMERIVVFLVVVECVVLSAFLLSMASGVGSAAAAAGAQSAELLTLGSLAPYFWGMVVVCGLVLPLAMAVTGLALHGRGAERGAKPGYDYPMAIGAVGALIGGCALRFLVLAAGVHAEIVAETVMSLVA